MKTAALLAVLLAAPLMAQQPSSPQQQTRAPGEPSPAVRGPSLALAEEAAHAAIDMCKAKGYLVGVTIVDDAGQIRLSLTADGAPGQGPNGSRRGAVTSALYKASGAELAERAKTDAAFAAKVEGNREYLARPGSLLLKAGDRIVGAIGVEGNPHDLALDVACAQVGADRIAAGLK